MELHPGPVADRDFPIYPSSLLGLGLVDSPPEDSFDNLTSLAAMTLDVPVSLVSILDFSGEGRQFFKSQLGLPEPWASRRETPLTHSFCQHVVIDDAPLIVPDALCHDKVRDNLAITDISVRAYLGVPVYDPTGTPIGALCVIDGKPRTWDDQALELLNKLAACVSDAIRLNASIKMNEDLIEEQRNFSYAIAHDLKAPANTLKYVLDEVTMASIEDPDLAEVVEVGQRTLERMSRQTQDVLRYTHTLDAEAPAEQIDLSEVVNGVLENLTEEIARTRAVVRVGTLPKVCGNAAQLRSVFQNLIENSLKYSPRNQVPVVEVAARQRGTGALVTVRDNGIGIPAEFRDRVFRPFERLHRNSEYTGTGLGLSLCRRVIEAHGGTIEICDASPKDGTQFNITLPTGSPSK